MDLLEIYHPQVPEFLDDLARTGAMERLRQVGMDCGCEYTSFPLFHRGRPSSRWEHSLGVGLIVWHFTGDRTQAAAGLLHDVSTPVFAHVVDFLRRDYVGQSATEAGTEAIILGSRQLREALERWDIRPEDVVDYHRYPVADNDVPGLSADRLEYTLRNFLQYGVRSMEQAAAFYADLRVGRSERGEDELMFGEAELAADFARAALVNARVYVSDEDRFSMEYLARLLRQGLEAGVLEQADLYTTEPQVIARLEAAPETAALWSAFRAFSRGLRAAERPQGGDWFRVSAKKRYIDPYTEGRGRASALSRAAGEDMARFLATQFSAWISAEA